MRIKILRLVVTSFFLISFSVLTYGQSCRGFSFCPSGPDDDNDGTVDGWGFANGASCIVLGGEQDTCTEQCRGFPYCLNGGSDDDNDDGWGFVFGVSCIVQGEEQDNCNNSSGGGNGGGNGGNAGSAGSCPSSNNISCPTNALGEVMRCGCEIVNGLGATKRDFLNAGANRSFIASAMMESRTMNPAEYPVGDGKTGDSFNAGVTKQNWFMMRNCWGPWQGLGPNDYMTSNVLNANKGLDNDVYQACRNFYGGNWFAAHRNGQTGLNNPNTNDIQNFRNAFNWTFNNIENHLEDDVRFWVEVPAI